MRFRTHQEEAKSASRRLVFLFIVTVIVTVAAVDWMVWLVWKFHFGVFAMPPHFHEANIAVTLLIILSGCALQSINLQKGGAHIARTLGATEVLRASPGNSQQAINIVDEMALAARVRAPRLFILESDAINAFAAGWTPSESIICITTGSQERLTRSELQGVIAHEFSHILHGDTRINMRMTSLVYGLQMIYSMGLKLMSVSEGDRNRRNQLGFFLGLALVVSGSVGWFAGRLLQASVSRQREYLADASAVQFTRYTDGIGGALRKIAHQTETSGVRLEMSSNAAGLAAHMMLSAPEFVGSRWLAGHPPVATRIERIYGRRIGPLSSNKQLKETEG